MTESAADALQTLNHRHEAIALWLIANPDKQQNDCAREFGYTVPWLSRIINSDLFQALYTDMCKERKEVAVHTLGNKIIHAASLGLDKTIEKLEGPEAVTERFVMETTNSLLDRLGFTGKADGGEEKHLHLHLTAGDLKAAGERARIVNGEETEVLEVGGQG